MKTPGRYAKMKTGSIRKIAYARTINPPTRLKYQKETGMTLSFFLSEAIHWTMNRMVNINWPIKPKINQKSSWNFGYR